MPLTQEDLDRALADPSLSTTDRQLMSAQLQPIIDGGGSIAKPSQPTQYQQGYQEMRQQASGQNAAGIGQAPGIAATAGLNAASGYTMNLLPTFAAAVSTPVTMVQEGLGPVDAFQRNRGRIQASMDALQGANPGTAMAANVTGTLASPVVSAIAKAPLQYAAELPAAMSAAKKITSIIDPASVAGSSFPVRAAAGTAGQLVGNAAVIGASNLLDGTGERYDVEERLRRTLDQVKSPSNLALSAVAGSITGKFTRALDSTQSQILEDAQRYGIPVSPDAQDPALFGNLIDSVRRLPSGGWTTIQRWKAKATAAINGWMDDVAGLPPGMSADDAKALAAQTVRNFPSTVDARIKGILGPAYEAEKSNQISDAAVDGLRGVIADRTMQLARNKVAIQQGDADTFLARVRQLISGARANGQNPTVEQVNNLYLGARDMARFKPLFVAMKDKAGELDQQNLARDTYFALRTAVGSSGPLIDQGLDAAAELRGVEEAALQSGARPNDRDAVMLNNLFASRNAITTYNGMKQLLTKPEQQSIAGTYLGQLFDRIGTKEGGVSASALDTMMRSPAYDPQVWDTIAPGTRESVTRMVGMISRMKLLSSEGSPTTRTMLLGGGIPAISAGVASHIGAFIAGAGLLHPWGMVGGLLGWQGTLAFTDSLLHGQVGARLATLASGQPVTPSTVGAKLDLLMQRGTGAQPPPQGAQQ